jgi:ferredoxin-NADP reductase
VVTHIVIFNWIAEARDEQIVAFERALTQLAAELKDMVAISHGRDMKSREGNGDYALIATFADKEGWDAYQAHPKHKAFVRDFVTPLQASRLTIQFES